MSDHTSISSQKPIASPAAVKNVMSVQGRLQNEFDTQALQKISLQFKLSMGALDDPLEKEADDMADKVMPKN